MSGYAKPWMSVDDQLNQLTRRGLAITDRTLALNYLSRIGYYRLSGYWYAFRERSGALVLLDRGQKPQKLKVTTVTLDEFKVGATFQNAVDLYVFDKKLRLLTLDALERIEVGLRVDIAYCLGARDAFAYLRPELLHGDFSSKLDPRTGLSRHHDWLGHQSKLIARSKEDFIRHCKDKYGLPLPIWIAAEVWDFGTMSTLYSGLQESDQDAIAAKYGLSNGRVFSSWLRSLNYLRNVCAHHSRLWNRNIVDQPKLPYLAEAPWVQPFIGNVHALARCYLLLRITRHLLDVVNPRSTWSQRIKAHLLSFPELSHLGLNIAGMGAQPGWEADW
ncbi:Abi family protein [Pseudomonas oryzihabitans]|uniref:Abi family protein n=1 Tax=Pseudomonas oryzihabitans TaxID=47885 RepID=UPI000EE6562A|nr:Abi family protein [Pseudomonas oryzihabitans]HCV78581.1 abortive phage resistance protein [Pseudomonas sp.]